MTNPNTPFNYYNGKIDERYLVKKGDILFPWSASIGVHIWEGGDAYLNQHIFKVVPKEEVEKEEELTEEELKQLRKIAEKIKNK